MIYAVWHNIFLLVHSTRLFPRLAFYVVVTILRCVLMNLSYIREAGRKPSYPQKNGSSGKIEDVYGYDITWKGSNLSIITVGNYI